MGKKILSLLIVTLVAGNLRAQRITITGTVRDQKQSPLPAVSVQVKGTASGVTTDSLGRFIIQAEPSSTLVFSAVGYSDTSVLVPGPGPLAIDIIMLVNPRELKEAYVKGSSASPNPKQMEPIIQQSVGAALSDFRESQNLYTGQTLNEHIVLGSNRTSNMVHIITNTPNGTIYTGGSIPVFSHKEDTRGTRYLFERWVLGTVIDSGGNILSQKDFIYNYDKVTRNLLLTQDMNQVVEVDRDLIRSFTLKGDDREYIFERISVIDKSGCLQRLAGGGGKYCLYKYVKVRFVRSDYHTDGMVESGNPYDEYVDESRFFILYPDRTTFHELTLRFKPLRELLSNEAGGKAAAFLKEHRYDPINQDYLVDLVTSMNQ